MNDSLVPRTTITVVPMLTPNDTSEFTRVLTDGTVNPAHVVAIIAKSEGHGLYNDHGRQYCEVSLRDALAVARGVDPAEVAESVSVIVSGGSPGVISPNAAIVSQEWVPAGSGDAGLGDAGSGGAGSGDAGQGIGPSAGGGVVVGRAHTAEILPGEIGRTGQIHKVADAVRAAVAATGITDPADIHLVMVKGPALTQRVIDEARRDGIDLITEDPGIGPMGSMCWSNDAAALGVATALGEVPVELVTDDVVRRDWSLYSEVALTSAGGEKRRGEVLVIGNRADSASPIRIGHSLTADFADLGGILGALRNAGVEFDGLPDEAAKARIVHVFAKFALPGTDRLRGEHITILDDHEAHHVAKAVGGALVVSVTGQPKVFVSGGERNSHMGPPGANPVAVVVQR